MTSINATAVYEAAPNAAIILGVTASSDIRSRVLPIQAQTDVTATLTTLAASQAPETIIPIVSPALPGQQIYAVFVGQDPTPTVLRECVGAALRQVDKAKDVVVEVQHTNAEEFSAIAEGALLGAYQFNDYRSEKTNVVNAITIVSDVPRTEELLETTRILVAAQNKVRDLVNTPAGDLRTTDLVDAVAAMGEGPSFSTRVWDEEALAQEGCGGILGVGAGSTAPSRLMRVEWAPAGATRHVALVGKGITFDSGGMSLKTHAGLIDMKTDMTGAATVAAVVWAAARLNLPVRVTAWLCIAENMLSGSATRVGDVLTISNGTTVEVNNTDAEGRLVLADGLTQAIKESPDEVIDVATLTGAQIVALGARCAGLMGTSELVSSLAQTAEDEGESMWAMPLPSYLRKSLKSDIADMKNSGSRFGGMLVAGLFLKDFVGETPWTHIDIAGPSFNTSEAWGYTPKGATGFGVRTLISHLAR